MLPPGGLPRDQRARLGSSSRLAARAGWGPAPDDLERRQVAFAPPPIRTSSGPRVCARHDRRRGENCSPAIVALRTHRACVRHWAGGGV